MIAAIASYSLFIIAFLAVLLAGVVLIPDIDLLFLAVSLVLGAILFTASVIDFRTRTLPNFLTLPLIAAGIAQAWLLPYVTPFDSAIGALAGYLVFWLVGEVYFSARGRDGLGLGDAKLLAAGGAWVGWVGLSPIVLVGSFLGLVITLGVPGMRREEIAFGPWLAVGIFAVWVIGIGAGWIDLIWS